MHPESVPKCIQYLSPLSLRSVPILIALSWLPHKGHPLHRPHYKRECWSFLEWEPWSMYKEHMARLLGCVNTHPVPRFAQLTRNHSLADPCISQSAILELYFERSPCCLISFHLCHGGGGRNSCAYRKYDFDIFPLLTWRFATQLYAFFSFWSLWLAALFDSQGESGTLWQLQPFSKCRWKYIWAFRLEMVEQTKQFIMPLHLKSIPSSS